MGQPVPRWGLKGMGFLLGGFGLRLSLDLL